MRVRGKGEGGGKGIKGNGMAGGMEMCGTEAREGKVMLYNVSADR